MFRTSYVHYQEDHILHAALYCMFSLRLCKQYTRLKDVFKAAYTIVFLMMNIGCSKLVEDNSIELKH